MFYEIEGKNIDLSGQVTTEEILKDVIETDQQSQRKVEMVNGVNYYNGNNDILQRDFREYYVDGIKYTDYNKSNDHIVNNIHKTLVDQKQGYICSNPVTIKAEDEDFAKAVTDLLGEDFQDTLQDWVKGACNKGEEDLHPFITTEGEFDYCIIPAEQTVAITDTSYQKKVIQQIRYYMMEVVENGETKERKRVEVWDEEKVTRYQEEDTGFGEVGYAFIQPGTYGITVNPEYHWYTYNTNFTDDSQLHGFDDVLPNGSEGHGWGRVPFVCLYNNSERRNDLMPIKTYVDAMDIVASGFINDLKDIQLAIWVLRGYEGEDLGDFMQNLMKFKAIKLDADNSASAEPKTLDIPKEARESMLAWLEQKIYEVGQGVNTQKITGGSITNVVIKAMYEGLKLKADSMIVKLEKALSEFMYFAVEFINDRDNTTYNYKDLHFEFDKRMLFNEKEKKETLNTAIEAILKLTGTLSKETILKLLVANAELGIDIDIEQELRKAAEERQADMESMETSFEE